MNIYNLNEDNIFLHINIICNEINNLTTHSRYDLTSVQLINTWTRAKFHFL